MAEHPNAARIKDVYAAMGKVILPLSTTCKGEAPAARCSGRVAWRATSSTLASSLLLPFDLAGIRRPPVTWSVSIWGRLSAAAAFYRHAGA